MRFVLSAFARAVADLRAPRVLALVLVPPLAALAAWLAFVWAFAGDWARWAGAWLAASPWLKWAADWGLAWIAVWIGGIAVFALVLPVALAAALVVTSLVAMPVIVPHVAARHYPGLEPRRGGTVAGSIVNAAAATLVFAGLWLVTLPLWLTGVGALLLPLLVAAHFHQRMLRYDALAGHATPGEYERIVTAARGRLFGLGVLVSACYSVPLANLVVPVLAGLAFTHLCLGELARLRGELR